MAISQISALIAHISFLFWELIFGRPVVGRSTPPLKWWFHRLLLWHLISFSLWELIFGKQRCWQIYPHASNGNYRFLFYSYLADHVVAHPTPFSYGSFPDCCSNSSYFIPTLRAHIWQTTSWQIYPPGHPSNGDYRFLLLELIFGRPTVGRSTPLNGSFTDSCSDSSYFIPTLRAHIWQTRNGQIYPLPYTKQQL